MKWMLIVWLVLPNVQSPVLVTAMDAKTENQLLCKARATQLQDELRARQTVPEGAAILVSCTMGMMVRNDSTN